MAPGHRLCALLVFSLTACSHFEPALCFAHCGHQPQVLDSRVGEITSSAYHSWSYRFGSTYDCWVIKGSEEEPITLSFSQFSVRCKKEWVSIKSSAGGEPVVLCGSKLPPPLEFPGGNISVVHHFLPHLFPVSSFLLSYARDSGDCPEPSFECRDGRCLPASWRCNGQVECLGSDFGYGADELGCEDEQRDDVEAKTIPYPDANGERDPDRRRATEKAQNSVRSTEGYSYADLWSPQRQLDLGGRGQDLGGRGQDLGGRGQDPVGRDQDPVGREQPHTEKDPAVTPTPIEWPCGGLLQTFYGTFSPPTSRGLGLFCVWTLDPQDSRPLRLDLQQLVLGPGDRLTVYNRGDGKGEIIKNISSTSNYKSVAVESRTGLLSLAYERLPGSPGAGFRATFHVGSYCPPWEGRCGGAAGGCFTQEQRCDGRWDCPDTGKDEEGCRGCSPTQFACGATGQRAAAAAGGHYNSRPVCYPATERCNYQLYCADGSDERDCTVCQPGTFHCDSDRCVFESWRCDGQVDCKDGTDELNCTVMLPRKVITAATVGSLVCGLLLVIAMGCTCKLYSLRTREYSLFAPISRQEAELIQQQAPPSYGQLIAQGIIPPVEDFPTESPTESSSLSLRGILQLLRQDASSPPHRRRRPRFVRRAVRRLRRWGLIPRAHARPAPPPVAVPTAPGASQAPPPSGSPPQAPEPQPVSQKLGSLATPPQATPPLDATQTTPPLVTPPQDAAQAPPPPYAPPAPAPPPSSPSLASIFHSLGLSISLFRPSPSSSPSSSSSSSSPNSNSMPLSASPSSFSSSSSSSDDEVLLIPLSEDAVSEDDVPMLT